MAYLTLKDINKIYPNGFHAVHDFNLEIEKGEFIVFVGPSGCGKSTTLRMIAGLEDISKGDFLINGERVNEKSPRDREVAMVFQSYALYPHMSVYENMSFGLTLQGVDEDVIEQKVLATAKVLGLTDYLDRKPRELSGGQRQRVAVGRAIIRKVDIFLMDEPLSNLDAKQRVTMRSEITAIHRKIGATTIYVTHDQTEAMTMADRIVVMKDGWVQQVGTPKELYFEPANQFVAGFIGEPPMNFIKGSAQGGRFHINDSKVSFELGGNFTGLLKQNEGKAVTLGFRPEAAMLSSAAGNAEGIKIDAYVNLTELLGDNANIYGSFEGTDLIFKLDPHDIPKRHAGCGFFIPGSSLYLFDSETEERIK